MPNLTEPTDPTGTPYRHAESKQYALAALDLALDELNQAVPGSIVPKLRTSVDLATVAALAHLVATAPEPELVRDELTEAQVTLEPGTGHDTVFVPSAANEPPVGTRVRTGDGTVFERIHRHGASWFEVMDNDQVSGINPRSWATLVNARGTVELLKDPASDTGLDDARTERVARALFDAHYWTGGETWETEKPHDQRAWRDKARKALAAADAGIHHVVADVAPDVRSVSERRWPGAYVTLHPAAADQDRFDENVQRIHIAGYGWLTLARGRKLAAALLSAISRAGERWCNDCQAHVVSCEHVEASGRPPQAGDPGQPPDPWGDGTKSTLPGTERIVAGVREARNKRLVTYTETAANEHEEHS